jgi:hypothetical protein
MMVHSTMLAVATDNECLMCGGISLGETVHFGSLELIVNCFDSLGLSPKGSDSSVIFIEATRSGSPSLRAMIEDSTDEFYTTSSGEGSFSLSVSRRHNTRPPPALIATTP